MDNISHTLAGLAVGELLLQLASRGREGFSPRFRAAALFASALANNFPDLDFVYVGVTGRPLGYLLHHRGHTHTLPIAALLGFVTWGAVWGAALRARASRDETRLLGALSLLGPLLHIGMDFTNNYGVHPFWPLYDGWFYGDAVFIVEPLFWATTVPALLFAGRSFVWRSVLGILLAAIVAASWALPFVPASSAAALTLLALGMTLASWRGGPLARIALACVASAMVAGIFFAASLRARAIALRAFAAPGHVVHAVALTPTPANPLCFDAWVVETAGPLYSAHRATVATLASLVPASRCPRDAREHPTAPLAIEPDVRTPAVRARGSFSAPLAELATIVRTDCVAAAFLHFARTPYWAMTGFGNVIGDLRYDRNPGLDFADIALAPREQGIPHCPAAVPPWIPPRLDVLRAAGAEK